MGTPSMGHQSRLGAGAASPVTQEFEFLSCDVGKRSTLVDSPGMRGTRSMIATGVNAGTYAVDGSLVMEPRPDELDFWLPKILGADEAATDLFALAETVPEFYLTIDKVVKVYTYDGCKVSRARFRSSSGQNLQLTLEIAGKTETAGNAGTFPAIAASLSVLAPYIHHQAVLTLGGTPYAVNNVELTIDNMLLTDLFRNSQTRQAIREGGRRITLACDLPFTADELALYDLAVAGVAGSLVYTNGSRSCTFALANLKAPAQGPAVSGKQQEIPLRVEFTAYQSSAGVKELIVTNDVTA